MLFIRDSILFRYLKPGNLPSITEALFTEINLRKKNGSGKCDAVIFLKNP